MLPLQWWAESAPPGCNRVKVSQILGAGRPCGYIPVTYVAMYKYFCPNHFFFANSDKRKKHENISVLVNEVSILCGPGY